MWYYKHALCLYVLSSGNNNNVLPVNRHKWALLFNPILNLGRYILQLKKFKSSYDIRKYLHFQIYRHLKMYYAFLLLLTLLYVYLHQQNEQADVFHKWICDFDSLLCTHVRQRWSKKSLWHMWQCNISKTNNIKNIQALCNVWTL